MVRYADIIQVADGKLEEYLEKHRNIWPGIVEKMRAAHIENFTIFHRDGILFKYYEYTGDNYDEDMKRLAEDSENQRWLQYTAVCQKPVATAQEDQWWAPMQEIFRL